MCRCRQPSRSRKGDTLHFLISRVSPFSVGYGTGSVPATLSESRLGQLFDQLWVRYRAAPDTPARRASEGGLGEERAAQIARLYGRLGRSTGVRHLLLRAALIDSEMSPATSRKFYAAMAIDLASVGVWPLAFWFAR